MKRLMVVAFMLILMVSAAFGANFYWKATYSDLNAISGKADGDRGIVITTAGNTQYYYHTGGEWVAVPYTFGFAIDNVTSTATDNTLLWRVPRAITITRWECSASVDNVVGNLMECESNDVTSCTVVDAVTAGGTTLTVAPTSDTSITDGAIAAGAWLRWSTTSVGTAATNRLSCTLQYTE